MDEERLLGTDADIFQETEDEKLRETETDMLQDMDEGMEEGLDQAYRRLGISEKEDFKRLLQYLLSHTFLLAENFTGDEGGPRTNPDYLFVETHFDLFEQYLRMAGFSLERDSAYGIITLKSEFDGTRMRFDKLTTIMAFTMRLIYEEEREKLVLAKEIMVTTRDLVEKMSTLGAIRKKPSNIQLHNSLSALHWFRIVAKKEGKWEDSGTKIVILPTILFLVSNEQITTMSRLLDEPEEVREVDDEEE